MDVSGEKHTVAWTLESNAALYAKWPPRHIPVAPNLPLQVGKLNKYSIVKLVSSSYDFNSFQSCIGYQYRYLQHRKPMAQGQQNYDNWMGMQQ